jgi:hypothetical protein
LFGRYAFPWSFQLNPWKTTLQGNYFAILLPCKIKKKLNMGRRGEEGSVFINCFKCKRLMIAREQNYIIGVKDSKYRKGPHFPTAPPGFYFFFLGNLF